MKHVEKIKLPNGKFRKRVTTQFDYENEPTLTQEQFGEETDVNNIIRKYRSMDEVPAHLKNTATGVYGDFSEIPSYQEALHIAARAEEAFMALPSKLRLMFNNDPQQLMDYLDDPKNLEDSIQRGLRTRPTPEKNPVLDKLNEISENTKPSKKTQPKKENPE